MVAHGALSIHRSNLNAFRTEGRVCIEDALQLVGSLVNRLQSQHGLASRRWSWQTRILHKSFFKVNFGRHVGPSQLDKASFHLFRLDAIPFGLQDGGDVCQSCGTSTSPNCRGGCGRCNRFVRAAVCPHQLVIILRGFPVDRVNLDIWSPWSKSNILIFRTEMLLKLVGLLELVIDRRNLGRIIHGVLDEANPIARVDAILICEEVNDARFVDAPFDPLGTILAGEHARGRERDKICLREA